MDDVETTIQLLASLMPQLMANNTIRREILGQYTQVFQGLFDEITVMQQKIGKQWPSELIHSLLEVSGLGEWYKREPVRYQNLRRLLVVAKEKEGSYGSAVSALEGFLQFAALAKNVDSIAENDQVAVITVHQAKGLEFDVVFVAGLSQYEFPHFGATNSGNEVEEKRLFYVAVSRAKQQLFLSGHRWHQTKERTPSPLVKLIRPYLNVLR